MIVLNPQRPLIDKKEAVEEESDSPAAVPSLGPEILVGKSPDHHNHPPLSSSLLALLVLG